MAPLKGDSDSIGEKRELIEARILFIEFIGIVFMGFSQFRLLLFLHKGQRIIAKKNGIIIQLTYKAALILSICQLRV